MLLTLGQYFRLLNCSLYLYFADLKAAYDQVPHAQLFNALQNELGVPDKIIKQLFGIYKNVFGKVYLNGRLLNHFNIQLSVK